MTNNMTGGIHIDNRKETNRMEANMTTEIFEGEGGIHIDNSKEHKTTNNITTEILDELEALVDKISMVEVVAALSRIAYRKSQTAAIFYKDPYLTKQWKRVGKKLSTVAVKLWCLHYD